MQGEKSSPKPFPFRPFSRQMAGRKTLGCKVFFLSKNNSGLFAVYTKFYHVWKWGMAMGKRIVSTLLCVVLLCLCAGCGGYKEGQSFTALLPQNILSLDPQTATGEASGMVLDSLFEGLCRIDEKGETVPGVARRWESNEDATEFTFHLRPRAQWSDGTPLTAQDFVFGITRALSSSTGAVAEDMLAIVNARAYAAGEVDASALGVVAQDDHTLVIRLEKGNPDFPSLTAGAHYMPCNQDYFQSCQGHYGLSSEYLITNGPFTFASAYAWQTDSGERSITVTRSETYRGERKAAAASVTYLIDYDEAYDTDPVAALSSGEVDIAALTAVQAQAAEEAGCGVLAVDDAVTGLLLNPQSDKLENAQLRSLFFKTLDRADLLSRREGAVEAQGIMADCVLWDGGPYYSQGTQAYTPQDLEATQELPSLLRSLELDEMPSITVICLNDEESINVVNGMLVAWNSALGNAFNLEPLSASQFQARIASGNYEAALYTLRAGGTTPYDVLKSFESTASPTLLQNEEYDSALRSLTFDLASYQAAEQLLQEQYVFYPLFRDQTHYGTSPNTRGITVSPDLSVSFTNARKR